MNAAFNRTLTILLMKRRLYALALTALLGAGIAVTLTIVSNGEMTAAGAASAEGPGKFVVALMLGAVAGAVFGFIGLLMLVIMDDSVYVPSVFTREFGLPAVISDSDDGFEGVMFKINKKSYDYVPDFTDKKVYLSINSGEHNSALIHEAIMMLQAYGATISGAVLGNADTKLIDKYESLHRPCEDSSAWYEKEE